MATRTKKKPSYERVPVEDVVMSDAEVQRSPIQRYDWIAIGDKAIALAETGSDDWQLVTRDGATSTASNITNQQVATLQSDRFLGWKFRARCTDVVKNEHKTRKRGTIWIKATRVGVI